MWAFWLVLLGLDFIGLGLAILVILIPRGKHGNL